MRPLARLWSLALALSCCGSSCGDGHEPIPPDPPSSAPEGVTLVSDSGALRVRVRLLRGNLRPNCDALNAAVTLPDDSFEKPFELDLGKAERALPLRADKSDPNACFLFVIEPAAGGEPLVTRAGPGSRVKVRSNADGFSVDGINWKLRSEKPPPACEPLPATVKSSASLVGTVTIKGATPDTRGGCTRLELEAGETKSVVPWTLCTGLFAPPFATGDVVKIDRNVNATTGTEVARIERVGGKTANERLLVWWIRGAPEHLPSSGYDHKRLAIHASGRADVCRRTAAGCATVELGSELTFQASGRSLQLRSGESAEVVEPDGSRLAMHVLSAAVMPILDPSCSDATQRGRAHAELIVIDRQRAKQLVAE